MESGSTSRRKNPLFVLLGETKILTTAMSRKFIVALLFVGLASLIAFMALRFSAPPPGIEAKGGESSLAAQYLSLTTSIVSLLTALVGLIRATKK